MDREAELHPGGHLRGVGETGDLHRPDSACGAAIAELAGGVVAPGQHGPVRLEREYVVIRGRKAELTFSGQRRCQDGLMCRARTDLGCLGGVRPGLAGPDQAAR